MTSNVLLQNGALYWHDCSSISKSGHEKPALKFSELLCTEFLG